MLRFMRYPLFYAVKRIQLALSVFFLDIFVQVQKVISTFSINKQLQATVLLIVSLIHNAGISLSSF